MLIVWKSSYDAVVSLNAALTNKVQELEEQLRQVNRYVEELRSQKAAAEQKAEASWYKYTVEAVEHERQEQVTSQLRTHLARLAEGLPSPYLRVGAHHLRLGRINNIKANSDGYVTYIDKESVSNMVAEGMDPIRIKAEDLVRLIMIQERNMRG